MTKPITHNTLFYGDNLSILREHIPDESIDLVYLDPPFNSKRTYNVLFKHESWEESEAQIAAFDDTWHWDQSTAELYHELVTESAVSILLAAIPGAYPGGKSPLPQLGPVCHRYLGVLPMNQCIGKSPRHLAQFLNGDKCRGVGIYSNFCRFVNV